MARPENANQLTNEFELLGHIPAHNTLGHMVCGVCQCRKGSQDGSNPCGDRQGVSLYAVPPSKPKYFYKGVELP